MKKTLLICILVLVLCASVLVACNKAESLDAETLTKMLEVIDVNNRNKPAETPVDYQLPGKTAYSGKTCDVKWTATNGVTVSAPDADGYVTVDVNEEAPEDINYTITATLVNSKGEPYKNDEGKEYSVSFNRVVKQFIVSDYAAYKANCESTDKEKASINIKAYIYAIILPSSGSSSKGSMYLQDKDGHGYYAYSPTLANGLTASDEKILAEYPLGTEVYVSGTGTVYSGQYEFNKGCSIRKTGNVATADELKFNDGSAAFAAAKDNEDNALIDFQNAKIELKNCTMTRIDNQYYYFKVGDSNVEFNLYRTNYFMSAEDADKLVKKFVVGDKATFRGLINVYSKKYQVYPLGLDAISDVQHIEYTDTEKVAMDKTNLTLSPTTIAADGAEITLPATGPAFGSAITWAIKETQTVATIEDGKLKVATLPEAAMTITLVATIQSGEVTDTKEITIDIAMKQPDNGIILTSDNMGLGKYSTTVTDTTVNGYKFTHLQVMKNTYDQAPAIQLKNDESAMLCNTEAFAGKITSVTINHNVVGMPKSGYTNYVVEFATKADFSDAKSVQVKLTSESAATLDLEMPEGNFTFIRIKRAGTTEDRKGTVYIDSIKILWEAPAVA